eukprot:TRINITY_DN7958_c0_g1_i1.p1 TRINITY_DN7958_c0_g1~~TRINITY_DN7958_c0_g1_i1.p1  ORF type:complete len:427 (-),score=136.19 TRINITY_DN7958_c0_g1_i1:336-1616(-)
MEEERAARVSQLASLEAEVVVTEVKNPELVGAVDIGHCLVQVNDQVIDSLEYQDAMEFLKQSTQVRPLSLVFLHPDGVDKCEHKFEESGPLMLRFSHRIKYLNDELNAVQELMLASGDKTRKKELKRLVQEMEEAIAGAQVTFTATQTRRGRRNSDGGDLVPELGETAGFDDAASEEDDRPGQDMAVGSPPAPVSGGNLTNSHADNGRLGELELENEELRAENDTVITENEELRAELEASTQENDQLREELKKCKEEAAAAPEEKPGGMLGFMPDMPTMSMPDMPKVGVPGLPAEEADQIWTSMSVLDFSVKLRISPVKLRKVGAIIKNMQTFSGITFTDDNINDVVRALFVDQSDDNMLKAFSVFDPEGTGVLDGNSFKEVLPLLGEKVPPEEIDALFDEVDADGSGQIEIDEFTVMIKRMNPPE